MEQTLRYEIVNSEGYRHEVRVWSTDDTEMNLLRRSMHRWVPTYRILYGTFHINQSAKHDEAIAMRLGLIPIDNSRYVHVEDAKYSLDVTGPRVVRAGDIEGIPFNNNRTTIVNLMEGERLALEVEIELGYGNDAVQNMAVALVGRPKKYDNESYTMRFSTIGIWGPEAVMDYAIEGMSNEMQQKNPNFFFNAIYSDDAIEKWSFNGNTEQ